MPLVNNTALRTLLIYAIILPLAVFIGWMMSGDMTRTSFSILAGIVFVLLLPIILKWHYAVLIMSWNSFITLFFVPGRPELWMAMAALNVSIALVHRIVLKRPAFVHVPSVTLSLLAIGAVVVGTAMLRGGIGLNIIGSSAVGGKSYVYILAGIMGYFALVSQPIPPERAKLYLAMFFLPAVVCAISNLIYMAGPAFYFLYLFFPAGFAGVQAGSEGTAVTRVAGFATSALMVSCYLLSVNGIRGLFARWWRVPLLIAVLASGALGGGRSIVVVIGLTLLILFLVEGLLRTRIFPVVLVILALGYVTMIPITPKLPYSMQRTLSVLPLPVDPAVRMDAEGSSAWRKRMWQALAPDLSKYIWVGKGYALNPTDLYLAQEAERYSRVPNYTAALAAGNYHNGPLSIFVPFGSLGAITFIAFLLISLRGLYLNYHYGDPRLQTINRFLFAFFLARVVFFFAAFGAFNSELYTFTGLIGLSVALNRGICQKPATASQPARFRGLIRAPATQPRPA